MTNDPVKTVEIKGNDKVRVAIRFAGDTEADGFTVGYESLLDDGTWLRGDVGFSLTLPEAEKSAAWLSKKPIGCQGCGNEVRSLPSYEVLEERLRVTRRDLAVAQLQQVAGVVARAIYEMGPAPGIVDAILPVITKGFDTVSRGAGAAPPAPKTGTGPFAGFTESQLDALRGLAEKYGTHTEECPARETGSTAKCTCGWDDVEHALFDADDEPSAGSGERFDVRGRPYAAPDAATTDAEDD